MSVLTAVFRSLESPSTPLSNPDEWLYDALGGRPNHSGERVNSKTALSYAPFWRGINLICRDFAKTPLFIYRRKDEGKERAKDDRRFPLLRYRPCTEYNDFQWKTTMLWRAITRGNSFAYIYRGFGNEPDDYIPLDPDVTFVVREGLEVWYVTKVGPKDVRIPAEDIIHFRGFGDGFVGIGVIDHARECIGLGLAQQKHASVFYKNGMKPSVVVEYPKVMDGKMYDAFLERWRQTHSGSGNMEKPLLLQNGMTTKPWTVTGRDAQFLEQRKFGVKEIANFLCIPSNKLGDDARTSFSSLEQSQQEYVDESIDPWFVMAESELREKLLTPQEKANDDLVMEFHRQSLMRTDFLARLNGYRIALAGRPYMVPDEVRAMENMTQLPDGVGSVYLDPLNMGNLGGDPDEAPVKPDVYPMKPAAKPEPESEDDVDRALRDSMFTIVYQTAARVSKRLAKDRGRRGAVKPDIESSARDEMRTALTPYCLLCEIDIDGAMVRALPFVIDGVEFSAETLAAHIEAA